VLQALPGAISCSRAASCLFDPSRSGISRRPAGTSCRRLPSCPPQERDSGARRLHEARARKGIGSLFFVISAAPREIVISALAGNNTSRTYLRQPSWNLTPFGGSSCDQARARRLRQGCGNRGARASIGRHADRVIYVGDGSSDVHVMLHVNNHDGFTIAVSENKQLARIARSTVLSENAFSIMVPILDQLLHWRNGGHSGIVRVLRLDAERVGKGPDGSG